MSIRKGVSVGPQGMNLGKSEGWEMQLHFVRRGLADLESLHRWCRTCDARDDSRNVVPTHRLRMWIVQLHMGNDSDPINI